MYRVVLAVIAFTVCAASPCIATAQTLTGVVKDVKALDKNFDASDKNHDGLLSKEEANAGSVPFIARHFDAIDAQHRGFVSKQDVHTYIQRSLQRSAPTAPSSTGRPT
jgi:hypothetical protein